MESYLASHLEDISHISGEKKKSNNSQIHINTNTRIFPAHCRGAQPCREQAHVHLRRRSQRAAPTPHPGEKSGTFLMGSAESLRRHPSFGDPNAQSQTEGAENLAMLFSSHFCNSRRLLKSLSAYNSALPNARRDTVVKGCE